MASKNTSKAAKAATPAKPAREYASPKAITDWIIAAGDELGVVTGKPATQARLAPMLGFTGGFGPVSAAMRGRRLSVATFTAWQQRFAASLKGAARISGQPQPQLSALVTLEPSAKPAAKRARKAPASKA